MRFIPTNCITPGTVIGETLYSRSGQILLTGGTEIKEQYIKKIKELGIKGIFIEDELSEDVEIVNAVSEALRQDCVKSIKKMFIAGKRAAGVNDAKKFNKQFDSLSKMVDNIVNDILSHKNIINNVMDIKVFDEYTYYHCANVAVLAVIMGISMGMEHDELKQLATCGLMHDIGKVFISNDILNKPGKLTEEEFDLVRSHSAEGFKYVKDRQAIDHVISQGVLDHHEKYDGTGYPNHKKNKEICQFGRIISVVDVYDALTSDRVYRKALPSSDAIEYIMAGNESSFDPDIVDAFIKTVDPYPIGTSVRLSNGDVGLVTSTNRSFPMRPNLKIYKSNGIRVKPYAMSLAEDINCLNITILGMANE